MSSAVCLAAEGSTNETIGAIGGALGEAAQGALLTHAMEPAAGGHFGDGGGDGAAHVAAHAQCLNCRAPLHGSHCLRCGRAGHGHKTLAALFHELAHGMLHFEGKIWRTLPLLAWHPGRLNPRIYRRAPRLLRRADRIVPVHGVHHLCVVQHAGPAADGRCGADARCAWRGWRRHRARHPDHHAFRQPRRRAGQAAKRQSVTDIDEEIAGDKIALAQIARFQPRMNISASPNGQKTVGRIGAALRRAFADPELLAIRMEGSAHKYSWLLIPLSVPFVWMLFPFNRRFGLYDHTVFVTYSLSFMLLLIAAISLAGNYNRGWLMFPLACLAPFHMHRHLRGTYGLRKRQVAWRTVLLSGAALFVLTVWTIAVLAISIAA